MIEKEYLEFIDDFVEDDSAFVLDSTGFNNLKGSRALLKRLEVEANRRINTPDVPQTDGTLQEDINSEACYLSVLAHNIRNCDNVFTPEEIIREINVYYRKAGQIIKKLVNADVGMGCLNPFIAGIADVVCAGQNYGVPRTQEIIRKNQSKFDSYLEWITNRPIRKELIPVSMPPPDAYFGSEEYRLACLYDEYDDLQQEGNRPASNSDNRLVALALTIALEIPSTIFTGDVKHVARAVKEIYGCSNKDFNPRYCSSPPELPPNQIKLYAGFEPGWKLWFDSNQSPMAKGRCHWAKPV